MPGRVTITSGASPTPVEHDDQTQAGSPPSNEVCSFASQASYETGYALTNAHADPRPTGTLSEMAKQEAVMGALAIAATVDHVADLNDVARKMLPRLSTTPPDLARHPEVVEYSSTLHHVSPQDAYAWFKQHPTEWFGASGITLHPPVKELTDGARVMLEEPGVTPPVWAPIEVHLDDANHTIEITTLDGHPLRGFNQFTFEANGAGEAVMHQTSTFQLSSTSAWAGSGLLAAGQKAGLPVTDPIERQHEIWSLAHASVADHAPRK